VEQTESSNELLVGYRCLSYRACHSEPVGFGGELIISQADEATPKIWSPHFLLEAVEARKRFHVLRTMLISAARRSSTTFPLPDSFCRFCAPARRLSPSCPLRGSNLR